MPMWGQGKVIGAIVAALVIVLAIASYLYTQDLAEEREARVTALLMTPEYQHCLYDESTCPQVEESIQVPNILGIAVLILALVVASYLFYSDKVQQKILRELRESDEKNQREENLDLILSVLREDEKKVLLAIKEQPGITQNTLRLRTDFSKAKLSNILKELEVRTLIKKEAEKKTNKLYLKRRL